MNILRLTLLSLAAGIAIVLGANFFQSGQIQRDMSPQAAAESKGQQQKAADDRLRAARADLSIMADAIREIEWEVRHGDARDPRKCPENRGVKATRRPSIRQIDPAATLPAKAA